MRGRNCPRLRRNQETERLVEKARRGGPRSKHGRGLSLSRVRYGCATTCPTRSGTLRRTLVAVLEGGERSFSFLAGKHGAPGAPDAGGVQILGVLLDV